MNLNDEAIDSPIRTAIIAAAITAMKINPDDIFDIVQTALETDTSHGDLHMIDEANADHRSDLMILIELLTGYDDDHDYLFHDLSHAFEMIDYCEDHPNTCATCCDDH